MLMFFACDHELRYDVNALLLWCMYHYMQTRCHDVSFLWLLLCTLHMVWTRCNKIFWNELDWIIFVRIVYSLVYPDAYCHINRFIKKQTNKNNPTQTDKKHPLTKCKYQILPLDSIARVGEIPRAILNDIIRPADSHSKSFVAKDLRTKTHYCIQHCTCWGPLLLTRFNFNPSMDE